MGRSEDSGNAGAGDRNEDSFEWMRAILALEIERICECGTKILMVLRVDALAYTLS